MKNFFILGIVLILAVGGSYLLVRSEPTTPPVEEAPITESKGVPTFAWSYFDLENEGIPYTMISLTATYKDGTLQTELIDTVEGNCNAYENKDSDTYEHSTMILCYYAGLGRYFKIVASEDGYLVMRKEFEEASPDYAPPVTSYETIRRF